MMATETRSSLYDMIADLPLEIDGYDVRFRTRACAGDFARISVILCLHDAHPEQHGVTRPCTRFSIHGEGETGAGEDVTYEIEDHRALRTSPIEFPPAGSYTIDSFSEALDEIDLFPGIEPGREASRSYRRWAIESAALDLALKQAETDLATVLGREYDPVRFLVSTRLGKPPSLDRVREWLQLQPETEFKLDATSEWTPRIVEELVAMDAVRIIDLKGHYRNTNVDQPADTDLYRHIIEEFDTLIEDPRLTEETLALFEGHEHRITWDAPITGIESIEELPFRPEWLNMKPSRFGSIENLLDTIEYCLDRGIGMYGGGQTELSVGRQHLHALASLFYPDAPNDIAPCAYNDPDPMPGLPSSPLEPPQDPHGLEWQ
jgi:L-alanine-DL-glutamate epimerase-like enolase superfamily enzyme